MQYSENGLLLTEGAEGIRFVAYLDSRGVPTIGYGHTAGVKIGDICTQEQADEWLAQDVQTAVRDVNSLVIAPLTQGEFDALVDFVFNEGIGHFAASTMLTLLNAGDYAGAANQFDRWDLAGGQVVAGLLRRRNAEVAEFNDPGDTPTTA
jgi:lysozyme